MQGESRQNTEPLSLDRQQNEKPGGLGGGKDETEYPSTPKALAIIACCLTATFLTSIDRTILSVAIPYITDEFHSIDDISWYASAYMLTNCAFQLIYGRLYKLFPVKYVFLTAIALFEIGSAICGAAPSSIALIVGRAIAGTGSAGVMSGSMQIMVVTVPLRKRPLYNALFSALFGLSSVVGPVVGGAFTQHVSWRWCFYVNLPCAALSVGAVVFLMKARRPLGAEDVTLGNVVEKLDLTSVVLFVPSIICLVLSLQWGGVVYPWNSGRIIALWVVFGVLFLSWVGLQGYKKDRAMVPPRVFFQRSIISGFSFSVLFTSALLMLVYYLPLWFQAIKGVGPMKSSFYFLPMILSVTVSSILLGLVTQRVGYYNPPMFGASIIASIGIGLLTTFKPDIAQSRLIAYQFLSGFGIGMGFQQPNLAAQTVLPPPDVPIGIAIMLFGQQLGGAVFLPVAQSVFTQKLVSGITGHTDVDATSIINSGATEIRSIVPASELPVVLRAYNNALVDTWYVALAMVVVAIVPACCMEWKSIKKRKPGDAEARGGEQLKEGRLRGVEK